MLYYIGAGLIIVGFLIYGIKEWMDWSGFMGMMIMSVLGVCSATLYCLVVFVISFGLPVEYELTNTYEIYALKDNNSLQGDFYLGTGNIDGSSVYTYVRKENGGKKVSTIPTESAILYEGGTVPKIEVFKPTFKKGSITEKLFIVPADSEYNYHIYIPKDSVVNGYDVDLQ